MLEQLENNLKKEINKEYKLIFISDERWQKEKEKYIQNLKSKVKYEYIEEEINEWIESYEENIAKLEQE